MKVYELLDTPKKWTKKWLAYNKKGKKVEPRAIDACKWCLLGAIEKCYPSSKLDSIFRKLGNKLSITVTEWNDSHSYKDVIALCKELDI